MSKLFVLDTNVLLHDPRAIYRFDEHEVVIPIYVLEEVDKFKKEMTELGRNARTVSRLVDELRGQSGTLQDGVPLPTGGRLRVVAPAKDPEGNADRRILQVALEEKRKHESTILVSMDINLRVRADAYGLRAENYDAGRRVESEDLYTGFVHHTVQQSLVDLLGKKQSLSVDQLGLTVELPPNVGVVLTNEANPKHTALGRFDASTGQVVPLRVPRDGASSIKPRNLEQSFALDLLLNDKVQIVTLVGRAGTGKTLLAVAAGLRKVISEGAYARLLVSRPIFPMGRDVGYLPGTLEEKLNPWMQPIFDNLEYIFRGSNRLDTGRTYAELVASGTIQIEPLTYIRGRSLPQQFMIVDECFPYETQVVTEHGQRQIGALFTKWMRGHPLPKVKSFNEATQKFVWNQVANMWHRGKRPIVEVHASNRIVKCTPNHPFLTTEGWKPAESLLEGDLLVSSHPEDCQVLKALTPDLEQVVLGTFLGDGSIDCFAPSRLRLAINHGRNQLEYCLWKAGLFNAHVKEILGAGYNPHEPKFGFATKTYGYKEPLPRPKVTCPEFVMERINEKGLAIWFMDDGSVYEHHNGATINTQSFSMLALKTIVEGLESRFGIHASVCEYEKGPILRLKKEPYLRLCELIHPWVHPNLAYKIHPSYQVAGGSWSTSAPEWGMVVVKKVVQTGSSEHVFDMEVEEDHNFLIPSASKGEHAGNGALVVHNCQNLSSHEIKTIITRCGSETKIVLTGDPQQIDNGFVDSQSNGLSVVAEKFKGERIAGHVTLVKGERSELAERASQLL